jgi:ribosomal RNA-processing protein 7
MPSSEANPFSILNITIPPLLSFPRVVVHEVRVRRNAPSIPTATDRRSLFLKNVPVDSTAAHLRDVISQLLGDRGAGRVEDVSFPDDGDERPKAGVDPAAAVKLAGIAGRKRKRDVEEEEEEKKEEEAVRLPPIWTRKLRKSGGAAVVLLVDEASVNMVLKAIGKLSKKKNKEKGYPVWGQGVSSSQVSPLGSPWITSHLKLSSNADKTATQIAVHSFFDAFNRKEMEAAELAKRLRSEPDEDGFITVVRGGRTAPASKVSAEEARRKMLEKEAQKKEGMKGFYRFQLREARKAEQVGLRKRFEEDKKRVEALRAKRGKFRPED